MTNRSVQMSEKFSLPKQDSAELHRVLHSLVTLSFSQGDVFNRFPQYAHSLLLLLTGKVTIRTLWLHLELEEYGRVAVAERDGGVCAICRRNTVDLQQAIAWYMTHARAGQASVGSLKLALGHVAAQWPRRLWEADHVIPKSRGGAIYSLSNLRTLCLQCHREETDRVFFEKLLHFMGGKGLARVKAKQFNGNAYEQKLKLQAWVNRKSV